MSEELKPCPFCGKRPLIFNQAGLVTCRYSMCSANPQANSKEDWNKRTTDQLEQENAELREALKSIKNKIDNATSLNEMEAVIYMVCEEKLNK